MLVMFALAQAVTVRMGHLLGAKEILSAIMVNVVGILLAIIPMSIIAFCYWFLPTFFISIDLDVSNPVLSNVYLFSKRNDNKC